MGQNTNLAVEPAHAFGQIISYLCGCISLLPERLECLFNILDLWSCDHIDPVCERHCILNRHVCALGASRM